MAAKKATSTTRVRRLQDQVRELRHEVQETSDEAVALSSTNEKNIQSLNEQLRVLRHGFQTLLEVINDEILTLKDSLKRQGQQIMAKIDRDNTIHDEQMRDLERKVVSLQRELVSQNQATVEKFDHVSRAIAITANAGLSKAADGSMYGMHGASRAGEHAEGAPYGFQAPLPFGNG
ncbi:Chromosome partition protein Smc [Carpediemonas membranifera]|uniref:Chromosome partition protein Smc n=1 Tax=Carpediemonas membranifera TaxID=201153 RepID=A0A8J6APE1_9EUKA|nr:Chromosome partition protein Smc [Carpediemonas membranifera]|eukprot:KAG9389806.1 Chromosome partition protein Smc [Carpediemonas membranifera]